LGILFLTIGLPSDKLVGSPQNRKTNMETQSSPLPAHATIESRTRTVRINRPFAAVYEFLVDPANWNRWAFGLGKSLRQSGGGWIADSNGGVIKVNFTSRNEFGVVDHTIIRPSGAEIYVPMRLIRNGPGCERGCNIFCVSCFGVG
jgi:hypothetical protein